MAYGQLPPQQDLANLLGPNNPNYVPVRYNIPGTNFQGVGNRNDYTMEAFWNNSGAVQRAYDLAMQISQQEQARANTAAFGSPEVRETIYDVYPGLKSTVQPYGSSKNYAYDLGGGTMYGLDFSGVAGFGGQPSLQQGTYTPPRTTAAAGYAQGPPAGALTSTKGGGGTFGGNASRWNVTAPGGYQAPPTGGGTNRFDRPSREPTTGFIMNRPAGYSGTPMGQRIVDQGLYRPGGPGTPYQPWPEGYDYRNEVAGVPAYAAANAAPSGTSWYSPGQTPTHPMAVNQFGRPPAGQNQTNTFAPPAQPRTNGGPTSNNTYGNLRRRYGG
jgi:hypothetical protein